METYVKGFFGSRREVEEEINAEAAKRKLKITGISAFYDKGIFYAYVVFEKGKVTSDRKRKTAD